jgi:hypothetical protein
MLIAVRSNVAKFTAIILIVVILNAIMLDCHYSECHTVVCPYAELHSAVGTIHIFCSFTSC